MITVYSQVVPRSYLAYEDMYNITLVNIASL